MNGKLLLYRVAALALCLLLCSCGTGGTCTAEHEDGTLSLHFDDFTGTQSVSLSLCAGDEVAFSIDRQDGRVNLSLALDAPVYTGSDLESGVFTVVVPTDGTYTFTLVGKRADGSVQLTWREG